MDKETRKYFQTTLNEIFKQNQLFLDKAVLAFSSIAIPLVANANSANYDKLLTWALGCFTLVIILHISALKLCVLGADKGLTELEDPVDQPKAMKFLVAAKNIDHLRDIFFICGIVLVLISFCNLGNKDMSKETRITSVSEQKAIVPSKVDQSSITSASTAQNSTTEKPAQGPTSTEDKK